MGGSEPGLATGASAWRTPAFTPYRIHDDQPVTGRPPRLAMFWLRVAVIVDADDAAADQGQMQR